MAKFVDGIEHVAAVFRGVSRASQIEISHALQKGAEEIATRARQLAPVDPTTAIDLKDQIEVSFGARTNATRAVREGRQEGPNSVVAYVTAGDTRERAQAAYRMEFGRAPGGTGPNAGHPGHPAQEFMFPAYFSVRNRVRGRVKRAVKKAARNG